MRRRRILFGIAIIALVAGGIAYAQRDKVTMSLFARAAEKAMKRNAMAELDPRALHIGFCGTGSPLPSRDRAAACTAVVADGKLFIFDMGEGSGETLALMGMPLGQVQGVWLTHLHSDHFEGLGPFTLQRWAGTSAQVPLAVFGPAGVNEITGGLNAAYRIDSIYRIAHHGEAVVPPSGFGLTGRAIMPGIVYQDEGIRITAFAVDHAPVSPAYGYRLDWNGRSVTISGDTDFTPALAKAANGSDVLVSELLSRRMVKILENSARSARNANRAKIFADIQDYHISPEQAADAAKQAGVRMLAFTHIVPSVPKMMESALIADAAGRFDGEIAVMHDGDVISIRQDGKIARTNILN